jgi:hypothetical protein
MKEHSSIFNQKNNNHMSDTDFTKDRLVDMAFITLTPG